VLIAAAPCPFTAFLACPALILGATGAISSGAGIYLFGNSKSSYQQAFELLEQARVKAITAEKALRTARVNLESACLQFVMSESIGVNYNELE
jgi:hypothetical protein